MFRVDDAPFYELVAQEIRNGVFHEGLRLKAIMACRHDAKAAEIEYIKLRVTQLITAERERRRLRYLYVGLHAVALVH
jgi:hypothetical protein